MPPTRPPTLLPLRHPPRSGGTVGLVLATVVGFGLFGSLFLTGNP